jgi:hypothetical protein
MRPSWESTDEKKNENDEQDGRHGGPPAELALTPVKFVPDKDATIARVGLPPLSGLVCSLGSCVLAFAQSHQALSAA